MRISPPALRSVQVRALRERRGLSQRELAQAVGITRQAVGAIESRAYVPNTEIALRLAWALECRVEDLFRTDADAANPSVELATAAPPAARRVALGLVRGRWVAQRVDGSAIGEGGLLPADGLVAGGRARRRVERLDSSSDPSHAALLLGCDPALAILAALVARAGRDVRLTWIPAASQAALDALQRGEAHLAGTHLRSGRGGKPDLRRARRALGAIGGTVVTFARWEEGLAVAPGARDRVREVADLARRDVRIVNRSRGAGARTLLDEELAAAGVPPEKVRGHDRVVAGHVAAASAVAAGAADAAVSLRAVADAFGLGFLPLVEERFDLVIPADHLEHPAVVALLDTLQSRELRDELRALPGYDVSGLGEVVARMAPAG